MHREVIYSGKAKTLYALENEPQHLLVEFRDDATAFNALKKASLSGKGRINNLFSAFIFEHLQAAGIATHFVKRVSDTESIVQRVEIIPLECVLRNRAAGNLCKRLGIPRGQNLNPPLFELYYKDDSLGDPFISAEHAIAFNWASAKEIELLRNTTLKINDILKPLFAKSGFDLIDFKLEFGRLSNGDIVLADEFSPDGCRLWDIESGESYDKDRFREDKGEVIEHYLKVAEKMGIVA
jgi:phosphoribosylaminoimidazole-succinocarboxamide synthase